MAQNHLVLLKDRFPKQDVYPNGSSSRKDISVSADSALLASKVQL